MLDKVAVIGAGSWGTTVASMAAGSVPTVLWARRPALALTLEETRENPDHLPGVVLPETLRATSSLEDAVSGSALVVMAVPSHGFRTVLGELAPYLPAGTPVLSLAKGLEQGTHLRMTEVIAEVAPGQPAGVLTGPNLAREIAAGQPAATVVAMTTPQSPNGSAPTASRAAAMASRSLRESRRPARLSSGRSPGNSATVAANPGEKSESGAKQHSDANSPASRRASPRP